MSDMTSTTSVSKLHQSMFLWQLKTHCWGLHRSPCHHLTSKQQLLMLFLDHICVLKGTKSFFFFLFDIIFFKKV
uniref:Uncharacterized protein n=1 Tax=Octopus bimaculoides TaxID=37653 RepID=A0A0L8HHC0_OCTBM